MEVNCPKCSQRYEVDEELAGSRVECEACGGEFVCRSPSPPPIPAESVPDDETRNSGAKPQVNRKWKFVAITSTVVLAMLFLKEATSWHQAEKVVYPAQPITAGAALDIFANQVFKSFSPKNTMTDIVPQPPYKSRAEAYYYGIYFTDVKASIGVWIDKREEHDRPSRYIYFEISADKKENAKARDSTRDIFWNFVSPFTQLAIKDRDNLFTQFMNLEAAKHDQLGEDLRSRKVSEIHGHYRFSLEEVDHLKDDYSGKRELTYRYMIDLL